MAYSVKSESDVTDFTGNVNIGSMKSFSDNMGELSEVFISHKQKLQSCEEDIAQWKRFIKDYNVLHNKIKTYTNKTSYEVMVPIGSLAYMKGKAIHTNEILVHLGESWFAERSCKNAIEIIERRTKVCEDNLEKVEKHYKFHKSWLSKTEELATEGENLANIVEHVTEDEYIQMNKKHKEKLAFQLANSSPSEDENGQLSSNLAEESDVFEKFLRLDALEEQERVRGELDESESSEKVTDDESNSDDDTSTSVQQSGGGPMRGKDKLTRRVSWADHIPDATQDDINVVPVPLRMKYRSRQKSLPTEFDREEADLYLPLEIKDATTAEEKVEISEDKSPISGPQSPSDLYKMINALSSASMDEPQPKSILKKKTDSEESEKGLGLVGFCEGPQLVHYVPKSPDEHLFPGKPPLSESPREIKKLKSAFNYKIVERCDDDDIVKEEETPQSEDDTEEPKKVSRFKAARLNKNY